MNDWNGNGRIDPADSFIDYQVYNEVMKSSKTQKPSGCLTTVLSALTVIGVIIGMIGAHLFS